MNTVKTRLFFKFDDDEEVLGMESNKESIYIKFEPNDGIENNQLTFTAPNGKKFTIIVRKTENEQILHTN